MAEETADYGAPDFRKFVIREEKTEWSKCSPLKTYSKKPTLSPEKRAEAKSRYGRAHKPMLSHDFLSTDKKVSQYLKVDVDNQMHYFKASPYGVQKQPPKTPNAGSPRRGRPPKSTTPKAPDKLQMALSDAIDRVKAFNSSATSNDLQAPVPTSTETIEMPAQLLVPKEEQFSDSEEVINEGDWNVGDLAWACVGGFPYWPCAITKDPDENKYKKFKALGKNKNQKEFLHVRFFGDKGRRSWIMTSNVIPFHGLDSFQSLAEETLTATVRRKDPKTYRAFTIPHSVRKTWQAAVSEAESLTEAPRHERITYFTNMFPPTPPSEKMNIVEVKPEPKKRGRKRKTELNDGTPSPLLKKIKMEPEDDYPSPPAAQNVPMILRPATPPLSNLLPIKVKQEPETPTKSSIEANNFQFDHVSPKIKDSLTPSIITPKRRGRPPGRRKKSTDSDFSPVKRKYTKKSLDQKFRENKTKRRNMDKKILQKDRKFMKDPGYEMFYDKNFDRVLDENPTLSEEDIEKFIQKMWLDVKDQKPVEFRSREGAEIAGMTENAAESKSESSSRTSSPSPPPIVAPSYKTPFKRGISLFAGVRNDKVCQVCFKNSEEGDIFKCRGPCGQPFHFDCATKPRYQPIEIKKEPVEETPVIVKRKRGRPRSVHNSPMKTSPEICVPKSECQVVPTTPVPDAGPSTNGILSSGEATLKRKRGRPRKHPSLTSPDKVAETICTAVSSKEQMGTLLPTSPQSSLNVGNHLKLEPASSSSSSGHSRLPLRDSDDSAFYGFGDVPRESYEKLLAYKRKLLVGGIFHGVHYMDDSEFNVPGLSVAQHNLKDNVDSDNNNETVKESQNDLLNKSVTIPEANDQSDLSIELNLSDGSVVASDAKLEETGLSETKSAEDSSVDKSVIETTFDQTGLSDSVSSDNTVNTNKAETNDITDASDITRSIFDCTEDEICVSAESYKFDNCKITESSLVEKNLQKAETNQSIEEEVQKGEPSVFETNDNTALQIDTKNPVENDKQSDEQTVEICHSQVENTRKSNLKLLGTLRGDSFESESSNNNLVVDDSSADDRLMIEESSQDNHSTLECSETNNAVLSISNDDTQLSDKSNAFEDVDKNLIRQASLLDMPDLDLCDNEEAMSNSTKKTNNIKDSFVNPDTSEPKFNNSIKDQNMGESICLSIKSEATSPPPPDSPIPRPETLDKLNDACKDTLCPQAIEEQHSSVVDTVPGNSDLHCSDAPQVCINDAPSEQPELMQIDDDSQVDDTDSNLEVKKEVRKLGKATQQKLVDFPSSDGDVNKKVVIKEENMNGKNGAEKGKLKTGICGLCAEGKSGPCFICGKEGNETIRCGYCGKVYHLECAREWPQSQISESAKGRLLFHCPQHVCHTCVSDNPAVAARFNNDRLARCLICPATYHYGNYCVPAGSELLSISQLICPRHYVPQRKGLHHVNASWCFLCSIGGSLICCDLCPNSFHADCLKISPPEGSFICEDCETGRYPLFGEIVWVKLGTYRWWPARILFPQEVPENINQLPHSTGEFAVEFFGSHDYYWVNRGRVFLYHEGDGCKNVSKSRVDELFERGVEEASAAFVKWTEERASREATSRTYLKPPKFVKILSNRQVGNVMKNIDSKENVAQTCECDPTKPSPCGPDADCINRLLSVECDPNVCPAGENCCNQNFEKRNYPRLVPFKTESRGWGLKTLDAIKKGSFIIEYVGEMIDEEEYQRRLSNMQKNKDENFYFLTLDKDRMLDAGPKGNVSRFMNHSCDPNCETQKWTVNGDTRVGLFALEDIKAETELVFNYNLTTIGDTKVECKCGSANCAGFIGAKNNSKPSSSRQAKTPGDEKRLKKRKKRQSKASKHSEETCFCCGNGGELLLCDRASCPKAYHLSCVGLSKHPAGGWDCPVHQCSMCSATKVQRCTLCINSYCSQHAEGNISLHKTRGLLCFSHNLSDSGSDWSDDRWNPSDEEEPDKPRPSTSRNQRSKIVNGHLD